MAGSIYRGYNNSSKPSDEYNVKTCPKCMRELFQSGMNVTITPWIHVECFIWMLIISDNL